VGRATLSPPRNAVGDNGDDDKTRSLEESIKEGLTAPITDEDRAWTREQMARLADADGDE
jgi:hypothetical protein